MKYPVSVLRGTHSLGKCKDLTGSIKCLQSKWMKCYLYLGQENLFLDMMFWHYLCTSMLRGSWRETYQSGVTTIWKTSQEAGFKKRVYGLVIWDAAKYRGSSEAGSLKSVNYFTISRITEDRSRMILLLTKVAWIYPISMFDSGQGKAVNGKLAVQLVQRRSFVEKTTAPQLDGWVGGRRDSISSHSSRCACWSSV